MSRSGYSDDFCSPEAELYRRAVENAISGRRGQAFLRELLAALDGMAEKALIAGALEESGAVCALGALGRARGIEMSGLDPEHAAEIARAFGVAAALVRELVYLNDEDGSLGETPSNRWARMRACVEGLLKPETPA